MHISWTLLADKLFSFDKCRWSFDEGENVSQDEVSVQYEAPLCYITMKKPPREQQEQLKTDKSKHEEFWLIDRERSSCKDYIGQMLVEKDLQVNEIEADIRNDEIKTYLQ